MKEEYVFPHNNWYLRFTEEERPIVDNWRINTIKFSDKPCPGNIINYEGAWGNNAIGVFEKITFFEFKEYVLNTEKTEDLSYLVDFLNKIK